MPVDTFLLEVTVEDAYGDPRRLSAVGVVVDYLKHPLCDLLPPVLLHSVSLGVYEVIDSRGLCFEHAQQALIPLYVCLRGYDIVEVVNGATCPGPCHTRLAWLCQR